jgi:hypothetical protein
MSLGDSIAALQKFDPKYKIIKLYGNSLGGGYGNTGTPLSDIPASSTDDTTLPQKYAFLTDVTAADSDNTVHIWYSPIPGSEKVIAVVRSVNYIPPAPPAPTPTNAEQLDEQAMNYAMGSPPPPIDTSKLPAVATLQSGIAAKYTLTPSR